MSHGGKQVEYHSVEIHEEVEEGEPWLVSYADMMTLLFGFFVLMYTFAASKLDEDSDNWIKVKKELAAFFGGEKDGDQKENQKGDSKELFSPNIGIEVGNQGGANKNTKGIFEEEKSKNKTESEKNADRFVGGTYVSSGADLSKGNIRSILDLKKVIDSEKALELIIAGSMIFENDTARINAVGRNMINQLCQKILTIKFPFFLGVTSFSQKPQFSSRPITEKDSGVDLPMSLTTQRSQTILQSLSKCPDIFKKGGNLSAMGLGYVPNNPALKGVLEDGVIIRINLVLD